MQQLTARRAAEQWRLCLSCLAVFAVVAGSSQRAAEGAPLHLVTLVSWSEHPGRAGSPERQCREGFPVHYRSCTPCVEVCLAHARVRAEDHECLSGLRAGREYTHTQLVSRATYACGTSVLVTQHAGPRCRGRLRVECKRSMSRACDSHKL